MTWEPRAWEVRKGRHKLSISHAREGDGGGAPSGFYWWHYLLEDGDHRPLANGRTDTLEQAQAEAEQALARLAAELTA